jgi:hypothetical protein
MLHSLIERNPCTELHCEPQCREAKGRRTTYCMGTQIPNGERNGNLSTGFSGRSPNVISARLTIGCDNKSLPTPHYSARHPVFHGEHEPADLRESVALPSPLPNRRRPRPRGFPLVPAKLPPLASLPSFSSIFVVRFGLRSAIDDEDDDDDEDDWGTILKRKMLRRLRTNWGIRRQLSL